MPGAQRFEFTTGPTMLDDIGQLSYNGCTFSPLFHTSVSSNPVKDNAKRVVKYVEHTITVEGYVTAPGDADDTDSDIVTTMRTLYELLTAQAGALSYTGRALDIISNGRLDVAWGPSPELLEFQPLGACRSAKVSWKVTTRVPPPALEGKSSALGLLQLNYETNLTYDDAGFSIISIKGTMEMASPHRERPTDRKVHSTVDALRPLLEDRILKGIDLGRFHITRRDFNVSRNKCEMQFSIEAEEKPYMDLPPFCTLARGTYTVRPIKDGPGLTNWFCTLRATYTVMSGHKRKAAYWAFLNLARLRQQQTEAAPGDDSPPPKIEKIKRGVLGVLSAPAKVGSPQADNTNKPKVTNKALIWSFSMEEGLYLDSRSVTFSMTWKLMVPYAQIVSASGLWRKVEEGNAKTANPRDQEGNMWAWSMTEGNRFGNIMGSKSWLANQLDPNLDIIVDFGSTSV